MEAKKENDKSNEENKSLSKQQICPFQFDAHFSTKSNICNENL